MRIMLVTDTPYPADPTGRGAARTLKALADRLIDTGHEVTLLAAAPGLTTYRGGRVVRLSPLSGQSAQIREALAAVEPQLVLAVDPGRIGRRALKHGRRRDIATVVIQSRPVDEGAEERWRAAVAQRADEVLVTAAWMVERLDGMGVAAQLWTPGVDTLAFTPGLRDPWLHRAWSDGKRTPKVVVGYVGALTQRHGVRRLAELGRIPGVRPVIIGGGPQMGWLKARLPQARFTGPLGTGDLTVALASLDVLVHPGETETCCHALREAGASGVPVVAPRAGGAVEVVRHLESGLLYDPGRSLGLVDAVTAVAADPNRALLGLHGRELARRRDWPSAVDELVAPVVQPGAAALTAGLGG